MIRKILKYTTSFILSVIHLSAADQNFRLDGLAEPSTYVHGCVNAITGSFIHSFSDITVEGPEALSFTRHYCSSNYRERNFGYGITHNHPTKMDVITNDPYYHYLSYEESGGDLLRFCAGYHKESYDKEMKGWWFHFLPSQLRHGLTNCAGGQISAKTNTKNTKLFIKKEDLKNWRKGKCIAILGDGTRRHYKLHSNMSHEIRPSGNQIRYEYDKKKRLSKILSTDASGSKAMGWIQFTYDTKHDKVIAKASNGKEGAYTFKNDKPIKHKITGLPECTIKHHKKSKLIEQITWQDNGSIKLNYYHDKVQSIYLPDSSGMLQKAYSIKYHTKKRYTEVTDLFGGKTLYTYSKEKRLDRKKRFHNSELYSIQKFYWGKSKKYRFGKPVTGDEGNIITKGLANEKSELLTLKTFQYDAIGNIKIETIAGHLTGETAPIPITVKDNGAPILDKIENYSKYYTYSNDDYNLVQTMQEDDGTGETYIYLPNSDKLIKKFIHAKGDTISREYFQYNDLGILTRHIIDDGHAEDQNDLSKVTQRLITKIIPNMLLDTPGFGKPIEIIESYWDPHTRAEHLLKRVKYSYGIYDLITEESHYDANNQPRYTLHYTYDNAGNRIEETDPLGRLTISRYNAANHCIFKELVGSGFTTHYTYDKKGRCVKTEVKHASGEVFTQTVEYDLLDRKIAEIDSFGNRTTYVYDDLGRLIQVIQPPFEGENQTLQKPVVKKAYNIWDQETAETDAAGNIVHKNYNCRGQVTEVVYPDGTEEAYRYNLNGTLHKKTQKNNTYSELTYGPHNRLIREDTYHTNGEHLRSRQFHYEGKSLVLEIDAMGHETEYQYDGAGRKTVQIQRGESEECREEYFYDSVGRLAVTRKWYGNGTMEFTDAIKEYDILDRIIEERTEDSQGNIHNRVCYAYDFNGNRVQEIREHGNNKISMIKTEFSSYGLPIKTTDPLGYNTYIFYEFNHFNALGQNVLKTITTDPLGIQTITVQDPYGRETFIQKYSVDGVLVSSEKLYYEIRGLKSTHIADAIANGETLRQYTIHWKYDALSRPLEVLEDPQGKRKTTTFSYTKIGTIHQKTKPDGVVLSYTYDSLGREESLHASDGSVFYTYSYDLNDRLLESKDELTGQTLERRYDSFGNMIYEKLPTQLETQYAFDYYKRTTQCRLHEGTSIEYTYGPVEMESVCKINPNGNIAYTHRYNRTDWQGRSITSTLITGDEVNFDWDLIGRLKSMNTLHASEEIPDFGYDPVGNLLEVNCRRTWGTKTESYVYDSLNQLTREDSIRSHEYQNDSLHNRLVKDQTSYRLNSLNQIEHDGSIRYYYDRNGNLYAQEENGSRIEYRYDALNRLRKVFKEEDWQIDFVYDSFGRCLQSKTYHYQSGWVEDDVRNYLYQGIHEIGCADTEGNIQQLRIMGKKEGPAFRVSVAFELEGAIYAPLYDHRFNVISLLDAMTGIPVESYRYSSFGHVSVYDADGNVLQDSQIGNPWLFGNKRYHAKIDLFNFGKRFYRPEIGRWTTPDPGDFIDGLNLYAYTHNGPMSSVDFYGFCTQRPGIQPAYGGMAHGFDDATYARLGKYIESTSKHLALGHSMQYVGVGIGRVLQGQSYSHTPYASVKPFSDKVGEKDLGNVRVRSFTGILTSEYDARKTAMSISKQLKGGEVYFGCNPSRGFMNDAVEAGFEYCNISRPSLQELRNEILCDYAEMRVKYGEDFSLHYVVHSRGALEFYLMTKDLPKEIKSKMNVYAIGPARLIPKGDSASAVNYCNRWDPVPYIGRLMQWITSPFQSTKEALFDKTEVVYTNYSSGGFIPTRMIRDHKIETGYMPLLKDICSDIYIRRGNQ